MPQVTAFRTIAWNVAFSHEPWNVNGANDSSGTPCSAARNA
jgi:hypothetical protein